jgi:uncharacterized membrane protein
MNEKLNVLLILDYMKQYSYIYVNKLLYQNLLHCMVAWHVLYVASLLIIKCRGCF